MCIPRMTRICIWRWPGEQWLLYSAACMCGNTPLPGHVNAHSHTSWLNAMRRDMKDSVCRMPPEALTSDPDTRFLNIPTTPYELPGTAQHSAPRPHSTPPPSSCILLLPPPSSSSCSELLADGTLLDTGLERFQPPELLMDPYPSFFAATSKTTETAKSSFLLDSHLSPLSPGALPGHHDCASCLVPRLVVCAQMDGGDVYAVCWTNC